MITLAKHIELLLLDHDCVIVPGLGGFIANHADAMYGGEQKDCFQPPYRTIGFNQQLQMNDGLLVQSYMMAYDTSYPFANLQMEKDLEKMLHELEMDGEYTLENIGTLKKGINQNITFVAPETGILSPALYGLHAYDIQSLSSVVKEKEIEKKLREATATMHIVSHEGREEKNEPKKRKDVVIHLNRRWIDFGISVAAAAVLLFCFSYPTMKNVGTETDTVVATFTPMQNVPLKAKEVAKTSKPATKMTGEKEEKVQQVEQKEQEVKEMVEVKEEKQEKEKKQETVKSAATEAHFTIVLASYVSQANAETFIKQLAKAGYNEGKYIKNGKVSRILYSEYATEADAQKALQTFRKENADFAEAWILEL